MNQEIERLFTEHFTAWARAQWAAHWDYTNLLLAQCQTPIEERLLIGLLHMDTPWSEPEYPGAANGLKFDLFPGQFDENPRAAAERSLANFDAGCELWCCIQQPLAEVDGFRCDFLLIGVFKCAKDVPVRIVIECDGHDYHERTKEQAARDRKRDRDLQAAGFRVMRFTGSELYRYLPRCVAEVENAIKTLFNEATS